MGQYSRQKMTMACIMVVTRERKMCKDLEYILKKAQIKLADEFKIQRWGEEKELEIIPFL